MKLEQTIAVLETQKMSLEQQHSVLQAELADVQLLRSKLADKVETISSLLDREREARMLAERELAVVQATYAKRRFSGSRLSIGSRKS